MSRYIDADFAVVCDEWQSTVTSGKIISEGKNMSRYIDVDKLIRKINEHECYSYDPEVSRICGLINDALTLAVEPVKHGRWIKSKAGGVLCSECCSYAPYIEKGSFTTKRIEQEKSAYCPNCGAKMDEEEYKND